MRKLLLGDQQFPSMINTQSKVTGGKNHKENGEQSGLTKSKTKSKLFAGKSTDNSPSIQRSGSPSLQFPNGITVAEFEPEVSTGNNTGTHHVNYTRQALIQDKTGCEHPRYPD